MRWQPLARNTRRVWWDTPIARAYGFSGMAVRIVARHLYAPIFAMDYANDRDQFPW